MIHNLSTFPYPFADNELDQIYLDNVFEHLDNPMRVVLEIHRIIKVNACVKVLVPCFHQRGHLLIQCTRHFLKLTLLFAMINHIICHRYDTDDAWLKVERSVFNETVSMPPIQFIKKIIVRITNKQPDEC